MTRLFYRLNKGLNDINYKFYPIDKSPYDIINNLNQELFRSVYYYTEKQVEEATKIVEVIDKRTNEPTKRQRGIGKLTTSDGVQYPTVEAITNKLIFDFDAKDVSDARKDCLAIVDKLVQKYGINEKAIEVYFSGGKGFHLILTTSEWFKSNELKSICTVLMDGLSILELKI